MTEKMLSRRDGAIGHMIFNQPEKHNAVSLEMWEAAERIMQDFEADPEIRVLVLSGAGGKSFVAGADISEFEKQRGSTDAQAHYNARTRAVYRLVENFPKPTIAMINLLSWIRPDQFTCTAKVGDVATRHTNTSKTVVLLHL